MAKELLTQRIHKKKCLLHVNAVWFYVDFSPYSTWKLKGESRSWSELADCLLSAIPTHFYNKTITLRGKRAKILIISPYPVVVSSLFLTFLHDNWRQGWYAVHQP